MLDWLGKMLDLPPEFLACSGGKGGGVIQGTASEATLVALLGAKARAIAKVKGEHPEWTDAEIVDKLVGYTSSKFEMINDKTNIRKCGNIFMKLDGCNLLSYLFFAFVSLKKGSLL